MPTLNEQFTQVINAQRDHLAELQKNFNARCDEIAALTEAKLAKLPQKDKEGRQKIMVEQKKLLDEALSNLKVAINQSQADTRHKLEDLQSQREMETLAQLEEEMAQV